MKFFPTFHYRSLMGIFLLLGHANAQPNAQQEDKKKEPPPCTVSILALGRINPMKFTSMKNYVASYSGIDLQVDKDIQAALAQGEDSPVAIPENPKERPPGPLLVYTDKKERKALEFSLNPGGVTKRFPVRRVENLDIYLAGDGATSASLMEGRKRKIHSIPIPETCQEMLVFFIKPPSQSWEGYQVEPVDFSPDLVPARSVLLVNFSRHALIVRPDLAEGASADPKSDIQLKPGMRVVYKIPEKLSSLRLLYSDPATPDRILCSVNCEARPDQRTVAFSFGLGIPENGVSVASQSLQFAVDPLKPEAPVDGARQIAEDDPSTKE